MSNSFDVIKLWQALGSISIIASYHALDPATERHGQKLSNKGAETKRTNKQRTEAIIIAEARPFWSRHRNCSVWQVTDKIHDGMNTKLEAAKLRRLSRRRIAEYLDQLRSRILD
jgi:hypothetical protein